MTRVSLVWLALTVVACAAKPSAPADAPAAGMPAPAALDVVEEPIQTVDDATRRLSDAERELELVFGPPAAGADAAKDDVDGGDAPRTNAPPSKKAESRSDSPKRCAVACRALGSMRRSAERLCQLTDAEDARCQDARARVASATQTVTRSCPACAS